MSSPSPQRPRELELPTPVDREDIVKAILSIRVGPGQPLRQVQVPQEVYDRAKKFVTFAPNALDDSTYFRFKVLYRMPSGKSIYELLITDADKAKLDVADSKITGWQESSKSLLRYALNLLLAPKRPEFQRLKLSSSYYVYQVSKKLKGAEEILEAMGYERVTGSQEVQELKYKGEVNSRRVAEAAADLVILDGELARVKGLVAFARSDNQLISLTNILQARSHPTEILEHAIYTAARYASHPNPAIVNQRSTAGGAFQNPQHLQRFPSQGQQLHPGTFQGQQFQSGTSQGQQLHPGASQGQQLHPGASQGQQLHPGASQGQQLHPGASQSQPFHPSTFQGQQLHPGASQGQQLLPGTSQGQQLHPGASQGQQLHPGASQGQRFQPGTSQGQQLHPGTSQGQQLHPGASQGQQFHPDTSQGQRFQPGTSQGQPFHPGISHGQQLHPDPIQGQHFHSGNSQRQQLNPGISQGQQPKSMGQCSQNMPQNSNRRGSAPAIRQNTVLARGEPHCFNEGNGAGHYQNITYLLDPSVVQEVRERQQLEETEQQQQQQQQRQHSTYVNLDISRRPPTSDMYETIELNQRQQEESRQSYVSSLNLPEPIVHTVDELERLQATSSDGGYNALSLLTDARSDPVGYSGPSFDSLISYQSPDNTPQLKAAVEDAWKVTSDSPKYLSTGSNGSWRDHQVSSDGSKHTSGSEDIYGSTHGTSLEENHNQLHQSEDRANVKPRSPAFRNENVRLDSDYEDSETVENASTPDVFVNYENQVERNRKPVKGEKELVKLPHEKKNNLNFVKQVTAEVTEHEYENQETIDKNVQSSETESSDTHDYVNDSLFFVAQKPTNDSSQSKQSPVSLRQKKVVTAPRTKSMDQLEDKVEDCHIASRRKKPIPAPRMKSIDQLQDKVEDRHRHSYQSSTHSDEPIISGDLRPKNSPISRTQAFDQHIERQSSYGSWQLVDNPKPQTSPHSSLGSVQPSIAISKPHTSPLSSLEKNSLNLDTFEIVDDSCISSSSNIASAARSFESPSQPPVHEKISATLPISSTQTGGNKDLSLPPAPRKRSNALPLGATSPIDPSSPRLRSQISQQRSFERDTNQGADTSNLDRHPRKRDEHNRPITLEQFPAKLSDISTPQKPHTAETPALVEGTWTCNYCVNIVFGNATDCDVCGNPRHSCDGTLV